MKTNKKIPRRFLYIIYEKIEEEEEKNEEKNHLLINIRLSRG
jgi:hypothetical protein